MDEVEQCLLNRIRDLGKNLTENIEGTWFIDLDHCVGRWEGCVLYVYVLLWHQMLLLTHTSNFRMTYGCDYSINCTAYLLGHQPGKQGVAHLYPPKDHQEVKFLDWVNHLITNAIRLSST